MQAENGMWKRTGKPPGIEPRSLACEYMYNVMHYNKERGYWVPTTPLCTRTPNLLLHSLNDITVVGEHPKTEYELVLQLKGYSPTVKNVQDPERNVETPYIGYIMN